MRFFVTGANGFIGRALRRELLAHGHEVTGMDLVAADGVVAGDVAVPGPWQQAAAGADVVVHTAAVVSFRLGRPARTWAANVLGTAHALRAAQRAGASRFVHFSSVTVLGFDFPDGADEEHPVRITGVPYIDTKIASEQVVLQAHAEGRMPCTVIRPADVYGPGARAWAVVPVQTLKARRFALPRGGIFSPVHVDDVARGVRLAATAEAAAGQVLTLSGGVGVPNERFFGTYAEELGVRLPVAPAGWVKAAAAVTYAGGRLARRDGDVNHRSVGYFTRRGTYSIARAERLLGWEPRVQLADGLRETVGWLRAAGHLPG